MIVSFMIRLMLVTDSSSPSVVWNVFKLCFVSLLKQSINGDGGDDTDDVRVKIMDINFHITLSIKFLTSFFFTRTLHTPVETLFSGSKSGFKVCGFRTR